MQTPLDRAHAAMTAAPEDERARLGFFGRLAEAELFLMLAAPPAGAALAPEVFALEAGRFVLAFDREERLAAFAGRPAPFAALSGRALAAMLSGQGLGLGLNLGAASEELLPAEALDWLAATLSAAPAEALARAEAFLPPRGLPERLIEALAAKLALAEGLARFAYLAGVRYAGGAEGHMLAFLGSVPGAEPALARAVSEALIFSGIEAGALDVTFLRQSDPAAARLARAGLRFDIPEPAAPAAPRPPGSDPAAPPRLR